MIKFHKVPCSHLYESHIFLAGQVTLRYLMSSSECQIELLSHEYCTLSQIQRCQNVILCKNQVPKNLSTIWHKLTPERFTKLVEFLSPETQLQSWHNSNL
ncbi:hypothetical protein HHI36_004916 [Cryptolaemus montrouzieri]|uniref:Uncharacterized protein n=1 Tax=Cryptolaemus montrouzieri TaxID=559131 RepID=A0ABD2NTF3_9CUCU